MSDQFDVIIIGSGAGGGTLAYRLAPSGARILLLERGGWLPREPSNWSAHDVFVDNRYISDDTWLDRDGREFQPQVHYYVGGATKLYGAALYRLRREDFGELQHHGGVSPAWPLSYEDLEPYYTQAEQMYEVRGARGEDPTEPPASAPYHLRLLTAPVSSRAGSLPRSPTVRSPDRKNALLPPTQRAVGVWRIESWQFSARQGQPRPGAVSFQGR